MRILFYAAVLSFVFTNVSAQNDVAPTKIRVDADTVDVPKTAYVNKGKFKNTDVCI